MKITENITGEEIEQEIAVSADGVGVPEEESVGSLCEYPAGSEDLCLPFSWWHNPEHGMDDRLEEADGSLDEMFEEYGIYPLFIFQPREEKLFLARFEAIIFDAEFEHDDAMRSEAAPEAPLMFIDFLDGMSCGAAELVGVVGELSSVGDIVVLESSDSAVPEMPETFFNDKEFEDKDHVAFSHLWADRLKSDNPYQMLAKNLDNEPVPQRCHWWFRFFIADEEEKLLWPVPGEFLSFCPRIWPSMVWNKQKSNPFMFSGNWMETVHYSNAKVLEVLDEEPYPKYMIRYRKHEIVAKPTDFAEYKVDDRVTILRLSDKTSWTWDDLTEFDTEEWVIAPISFYDDVANKED
jgi:hypothetical protein